MVKIGNDWDKILEDEFKKDYYKNIRNTLIYEYKNYEVYPPVDEVFNSLKYTSFENTKVIIIGQDPYINYREAHGLAFSVNLDISIPPSLKNIFKELENDCGCFIPNNGYLVNWALQGVLLLNNILTVRKGESNSHSKIGWDIFTSKIIEILNENKNNLVFMLWGKYAQKKASYITPKKHLVLTAAHPSPLAGGRFFGCKHFSKANKYLCDNNIKQINWQIPNK